MGARRFPRDIFLKAKKGDAADSLATAALYLTALAFQAAATLYLTAFAPALDVEDSGTLQAGTITYYYFGYTYSTRDLSRVV